MLVHHLAVTITSKKVASAARAATDAVAYGIRAHASRIRTDFIRWTDMPAGPAVVGIVQDIRLAAVVGVAVTIAKAEVAERDDAGSVRTGTGSVR